MSWKTQYKSLKAKQDLAKGKLTLKEVIWFIGIIIVALLLVVAYFISWAGLITSFNYINII